MWSLTPDIIHQHYQRTLSAVKQATCCWLWCVSALPRCLWCEGKEGVKYLSSCDRNNCPAARLRLTTVDAQPLSTNTPARHAHLTHLCLTVWTKKGLHSTKTSLTLRSIWIWNPRLSDSLENLTLTWKWSHLSVTLLLGRCSLWECVQARGELWWVHCSGDTLPSCMFAVVCEPTV